MTLQCPSILRTICFLLLYSLLLQSLQAKDINKGASPASEAFLTKIQKALTITETLIKNIIDEWDIHHYPKFLKSCYMHKSAWETMKWKYMHKILTKEITDQPTSFIISYSGSSVTAGHDSFFNQSTPIVAGEYMQAAFTAMDLEFQSRNVALGNNPCMPYDLCIKFFAGYDADVVVWEQNYFCDGSALMEQFIRQAMTMPNRPIVAFSESNTGHWDKNSCQKGPHRLTANEQDLVKSNLENLVSEMNKDEFHKTWSTVSTVMKLYHGAAIQTFQHATFQDYACLGPYIRTWMEGAASWHPSVIGHRVRAAHHAYFWLNIYKEALQEISWSKRALSALLLDVDHHLNHNYKPLSEKPSFTTPFVDNVTCYTDYEPRLVREVSLKSQVISGLAPDTKSPGWKFLIYENLVDPKLVEKSYSKGYQDFKYLIYSDETAGDLSVKLPISKKGPVFICQTPGIWGSLPSGFTKFWEAPIEVFITYHVNSYENFQFNIEKAVRQTLYHDQFLDICLQVKNDEKKEPHPPGNHVLTIQLKEKKKLIFAWLITP